MSKLEELLDDLDRGQDIDVAWSEVHGNTATLMYRDGTSIRVTAEWTGPRPEVSA